MRFFIWLGQKKLRCCQQRSICWVPATFVLPRARTFRVHSLRMWTTDSTTVFQTLTSICVNIYVIFFTRPHPAPRHQRSIKSVFQVTSTCVVYVISRTWSSGRYYTPAPPHPPNHILSMCGHHENRNAYTFVEIRVTINIYHTCHEQSFLCWRYTGTIMKVNYGSVGISGSAGRITNHSMPQCVPSNPHHSDHHKLHHSSTPLNRAVNKCERRESKGRGCLARSIRRIYGDSGRIWRNQAEKFGHFIFGYANPIRWPEVGLGNPARRFDDLMVLARYPSTYNDIPPLYAPKILGLI